MFPRVEKRDLSPSLARICETLQLIPPVLACSPCSLSVLLNDSRRFANCARVIVLDGPSLPSFPGNGINFAGQFPPAKYAFRYPRIVRKLQVGRLISESLINCCLLCVETLCLRQSVRSLNFYYSILFIRLSFSEVKLL